MKVLIVESDTDLAAIWERHLMRQGADVCRAGDQDTAIDIIQRQAPDVIVLDLMLSRGSALAVADYASYRRPEARVVFVTSTTFFSDGSIFSHAPNACAYLKSETPPEDLAAIVEHYGTRSV